MAAAATAAAATTDSSSDSHSKEEAATSYLPSPSTRLPDAHDTVLTACSLETTCCVTPPPDGYSGAGVDCAVLAVCGTYQLVKGPEGTGSALDTRKGSLRLYELLGDRGEGGGGEAAPQLVERQVLELAAEGVLDCKWCVSSVCVCLCPLGCSGYRRLVDWLVDTPPHQRGIQTQKATILLPATRPGGSAAAGVRHIAGAGRHLHIDTAECGRRGRVCVGPGRLLRWGGGRVYGPGIGTSVRRGRPADAPCMDGLIRAFDRTKLPESRQVLQIPMANRQMTGMVPRWHDGGLEQQRRHRLPPPAGGGRQWGPGGNCEGKGARGA